MQMPQAINRVLAHKDLSADEMTEVMQTIMTGGATPAQIGGFLIGLRMKGETVKEIAAAASVMRQLATGVDIGGLDHTVDIVGTGGDSSGTFNISTASMFVAAAAGCHVAKHGNRSVSSNSGSADVLEAAGVRLDLDAEQVARCVREVGVGFMFAPGHHSAMKHAIGPRREMGARTIFNVLGPLTNPAGVPNQLLGVFDAELLEPLANVLQPPRDGSALARRSRRDQHRRQDRGGGAERGTRAPLQHSPRGVRHATGTARNTARRRPDRQPGDHPRGTRGPARTRA